MEDILKTALAPKIYMVDTNVFRYHGYNIGDSSSHDEIKRKKHQADARAFFEMVLADSKNKKAILLVSDETELELSIQAHTLKKESINYNKLLTKFHVECTEVPKTLEFQLREFSNYIRGKYAGKLVTHGVRTEYLRASDARIFVHAYLNDAILVTANVKDFFFYSLFFDPAEDDTLFDILSKSFIKLLPSARQLLQNDPKFHELLTEMQKLKY